LEFTGSMQRRVSMPEAKTAVVETPAAAPEKEASKRQQWRSQSTVTLTEKGATNPKKPNSMSADRYNILLKLAGEAKGKPVSIDLLFRAGYRMDDVRHDSAHGFIDLSQPFEL
jgi:hypothetical protein